MPYCDNGSWHADCDECDWVAEADDRRDAWAASAAHFEIHVEPEPTYAERMEAIYADPFDDE